jgi:signal transduction histidine kinase
MTNSTDVWWTIMVSTMVLLLFIGLVILLVVVNSNRMNKHRAQMVKADLLREQQVTMAEREATQQTLREIGRELHDNVAQVLTVAQMGLNRELDQNNGSRYLLAASDALEQGIEEVRRLGHDLNSDLWQDRSLADAISADAARIERVARLRCLVELAGTPPVLPPDTCTILFRVFQEVVNNTLKHSGADTLTVSLDATGPLVMTIADNGSGFDMSSINAKGGLVNISRRCALVGYTARCVSAPASGCTWIIQPIPHGNGTQGGIGG